MRTQEEVIADIKTEIDRMMEADALARSTEYRLSDAIREGASQTTHYAGWGAGENACALSAAALAAKARGLI
jgi:hypothetical protein